MFETKVYTKPESLPLPFYHSVLFSGVLLMRNLVLYLLVLNILFRYEPEKYFCKKLNENMNYMNNSPNNKAF